MFRLFLLPLPLLFILLGLLARFLYLFFFSFLFVFLLNYGHVRLHKLLGLLYLLFSRVLYLVEVFAQLDVSKLLQVELILTEIGHTFS